MQHLIKTISLVLLCFLFFVTVGCSTKPAIYEEPNSDVPFTDLPTEEEPPLPDQITNAIKLEIELPSTEYDLVLDSSFLLSDNLALIAYSGSKNKSDLQKAVLFLTCNFTTTEVSESLLVEQAENEYLFWQVSENSLYVYTETGMKEYDPQTLLEVQHLDYDSILVTTQPFISPNHQYIAYIENFTLQVYDIQTKQVTPYEIDVKSDNDDMPTTHIVKIDGFVNENTLIYTVDNFNIPENRFIGLLNIETGKSEEIVTTNEIAQMQDGNAVFANIRDEAHGYGVINTSSVIRYISKDAVLHDTKWPNTFLNQVGLSIDGAVIAFMSDAKNTEGFYSIESFDLHSTEFLNSVLIQYPSYISQLSVSPNATRYLLQTDSELFNITTETFYGSAEKPVQPIATTSRENYSELTIEGYPDAIMDITRDVQSYSITENNGVYIIADNDGTLLRTVSNPRFIWESEGELYVILSALDAKNNLDLEDTSHLEEGQGIGVFSASGRWMVSPKYDEFVAFDNYFILRKSESGFMGSDAFDESTIYETLYWGLDAKPLFETVYGYGTPFYYGRATVHFNGDVKDSIIDAKGQVVLDQISYPSLIRIVDRPIVCTPYSPYVLSVYIDPYEQDGTWQQQKVINYQGEDAILSRDCGPLTEREQAVIGSHSVELSTLTSPTLEDSEDLHEISLNEDRSAGVNGELGYTWAIIDEGYNGPSDPLYLIIALQDSQGEILTFTIA